MSGPTPKAAQGKKLGLDKPCSQCGAAIYFNYSGPLEGICGKCTDVIRRRLAPRDIRPAGSRPAGTVRRRGFGMGALTGAFLAGAAAVAAAAYLQLLPF